MQCNLSFTPRNIVNLFIVYKLDSWSWGWNTDSTLGDCLFGAVMLAKDADPDKYLYSGYGIGFSARLSTMFIAKWWMESTFCYI